jgi:hypothetical protein
LLIIDEGNQLIRRAGEISKWQAKIFKQCRNNAFDVLVALHSFTDIHASVRGHVKCIVIWDTPDNITSPKDFQDWGYDDDHQELFDKTMKIKSKGYGAIQIMQRFEIWYSKKFAAQLKAQRTMTKQPTLKK